ncbi:MAG: ABC transporter ATP-binding protein [Candidatus Omnitrophota bacterium]|nr:MAG: ABC transporter ATP-binding protein [Candidatus Omnitrophota bacterium]HDN86480.1 ABC transporter ATP-binding protein [Candidatus Omnitrophota bacterium]
MSKLIEINSLSKVYRSGKDRILALDKVNLTVEKNTYLAIVGPSGAGKSTFLHILGGLEPPTQGEVFFEGINIYRMKEEQLSLWRREKVGFVFQFYHLIEELTVAENLLLPLLLKKGEGKFTFKRIQDLLQYLEIEEKVNAFPSELSGGEKQRVAIARALIAEPEVLLCDEPTGNLDASSAAKIKLLLKRLHQEREKTIILVTHNIELAKEAEEVVYIKRGRIFS